MANGAVPEAQAHDLTGHVLNARDPAVQIHPSVGATRAEDARANRVLPFHPGAARFYREASVARSI